MSRLAVEDLLIEEKRRRNVVSFEPLEERRLFSTRVLLVPVSATPGLILHERAGVGFTADLGNFVTIAPGDNLESSIAWGDGTTSTGTIQADGVVGLDEIKFELDGSHTYLQNGTYLIHAVVYQPGPDGTDFVRLVARFNDRAIVSFGNLLLDGTISGTYLAAPTAATIGAEYIFEGTGAAGDMGPVAAHGDIIVPGPLSATNAGVTGMLTLASIGTTPANSGTVTLQLSAPPPSALGAFPTTLHYVITGGTGAFAGASGEGTISVTLGGPIGSNAFTFVINSLLPPTPLA